MSAGISQPCRAPRSFAPTSIVWKIRKHSAPTFGSSLANAMSTPTERTKKRWPRDDDDRDFSEWNDTRERQRQFETAPQHAERRGSDPARQCREGAAQLFRPPGRRCRHGCVQPGAVGSRGAVARSVMNYVKGNPTKASELLGLNRGTLRKKLKQYDLL